MENYPPGFVKDTVKARPPSEFHRYGEGKARTEQLPDTEATAPKTGPKEPCGPSLTLTANQLREALELCDADDSPVTLTLREPFEDSESGKLQPAGIYAHYTENPEEGVFGPLSPSSENA